MIGGAAGHDEDLVDVAELLIRQALLVQHDPVVDEVAQQRVRYRVGLLGDLLEHEVLVAALLGGRGVPVDVEPAVVDVRHGGVAVEIGDPVAPGGDDHRLVLAQLDGLAGVFDERRDVGADEHLAVTHAEHQRGRPPRSHDRARLVGMGEHQGEMPFQAAQHGQHRRREIAGVPTVGELARHQVYRDLGVGVAGELHARELQLVTQRGVVLDDAVVYDRDLAGGIAVRVGVAIGRPAMRRPPGVPEPGRSAGAVDTGLVQRCFQVRHATRLATHDEPTTTVEKRDACRVVSPVLHAAQRIDDDLAGRALPDVADDSAHSQPGYGRSTSNPGGLRSSGGEYQEALWRADPARSTARHAG